VNGFPDKDGGGKPRALDLEGSGGADPEAAEEWPLRRAMILELDFFFDILLVEGLGTSAKTDVVVGSGGGGTFLRKSAKLSSS